MTIRSVARDPRIAVVLLVVCLASPIRFVWGEVWLLPDKRDFASQDGTATVSVSPGTKDSPGSTAAVYRQAGSRRTLVWSGPLVNSRAPVDVYLSDDAKALITLDDWGALGTHAVVIYDEKGHVLADYDFNKSLSRHLLHESPPLLVSTSEVQWRKNSVALFGPRGETFCLRFPAGTVMVFYLRNGKDITSEPGELRTVKEEAVTYVEKALPTIAADLLTSTRDEDLETGAIMAGQLKLRATADRLRALLRSDAVIFGGSGGTEMVKIYYVRRAAKGALAAMGLEPGPVVTEEPLGAAFPK